MSDLMGLTTIHYLNHSNQTHLAAFLDNDWCTGGEVISWSDEALEREAMRLSPKQVNDLLLFWHGREDQVVRRPFFTRRDLEKLIRYRRQSRELKEKEAPRATSLS